MADKYGTNQLEVGFDDDDTVPIFEITCEDSDYVSSQSDVNSEYSPQSKETCVAPFVRQFARTDRAWFDAQPWAHLSQWLVAFENSEAFAAVMHKHPLWMPA